MKPKQHLLIMALLGLIWSAKAQAQAGTSAADPDPELEAIHAQKLALQRQKPADNAPVLTTVEESSRIQSENKRASSVRRTQAGSSPSVEDLERLKRLLIEAENAGNHEEATRLKEEFQKASQRFNNQ
ncbi:MAG: hypothetical protein N2050_00795 [Flavobacteriales bacterium]|nr:hypothetical protein [Flavobacteriales bacterium]